MKDNSFIVQRNWFTGNLKYTFKCDFYFSDVKPNTRFADVFLIAKIGE